MTDDYDPTRYPPFAVTCDLVVFTVVDGELKVLLVKRGAKPYKGRWALPGGFVREKEDLAKAAARELAEETGVSSAAGHLEQLGAYGAPRRDPRMRVVTVAYWAIVPHLPEPKADTDAAEARVMDVAEILRGTLKLAFDHRQILADGLEAARTALETSTVAADFCHSEFTITDLRQVYEAVWGVNLDPGNFQKKVLDIPGFVVPTGRLREGGKGRPPELYERGGSSTIEPPFRRPAERQGRPIRV